MSSLHPLPCTSSSSLRRLFFFPLHPFHFLPSSSLFFPFLLLLPITLLPFPSAGVTSLQCYECFHPAPICNRSSSCTGTACILYENMPNRSTTAFCLLATPVAHNRDSPGLGLAQGCWRDEAGAGGGVLCVCTGDFCNLPRDPWAADPKTVPIPGLTMLDRNPFVDYEYLDEEKAMESGDTSRKETEDEWQWEEEEKRIGEEDPELPEVGGTEQDLMPVDFSDYLDWEKRVRFRKNQSGDVLEATRMPAAVDVMNPDPDPPNPGSQPPSDNTTLESTPGDGASSSSRPFSNLLPSTLFAFLLFSHNFLPIIY